MVISLRLISSEKMTAVRPCLIAADRAMSSPSVELCVGIIDAPARYRWSVASTWMQRTGTLGIARTSVMNRCAPRGRTVGAALLVHQPLALELEHLVVRAERERVAVDGVLGARPRTRLSTSRTGSRGRRTAHGCPSARRWPVHRELHACPSGPPCRRCRAGRPAGRGAAARYARRYSTGMCLFPRTPRVRSRPFTVPSRRGTPGTAPGRGRRRRSPGRRRGTGPPTSRASPPHD